MATEVDQWLGVAMDIAINPVPDRYMSEVESLVRGLRWFKDHAEVQHALTVLSETRVFQGDSPLDQSVVVKRIERLCRFEDPHGRPT